ncbi:MAG TPA: hypothetical protein VF618_00675 [Thermoanaerobaculia bacterium]
MTRTDHAQAPQSATGTCRERRRPQQELRGERRPEWVRPMRRVQKALDASIRLLNAGLATAARSGRVLTRRPLDSSRKLEFAEGRLALASARLAYAARELAATAACLEREPETAAGAPALLMEASQRWMAMQQSIDAASGAIFTFHENVLAGLRSGALVPERESTRRPRIILAPRPIFVRAFLTARQPRVVDRISSVLQRRRRAPRPASVSVPRRASQGRAPPLSSDLPFSA